MSSPKLEVEDRALLTPDQRTKILAYMQTLGTIEEVNRYMIDYSGENRSRTLVLRINNGAMERVEKDGGLADTVRLEKTTKLSPSRSLETVLGEFATEGYASAHVSHRHLHIVRTHGLEWSVRDVLHHTSGEHVATLLDIEALDVTEDTVGTAEAAVARAFASQEIQPLTKEEWKTWVTDIYEHVDGVFEYSVENAQKLSDSIT